MHDVPFEYVASISARHYVFPALSADQQRWFCSSDIRGGLYKEIEAVDLLPLDAKIIESMREAESVFMHMMARLEFARRVSYAERKRLYLWHLRVWNDFLERQKINLCIAGIIPHEIPDNIIYSLCKNKKIPTFIFHHTQLRDRAVFMEDWHDSGADAFCRYEELCKEYAGKAIADIPLSPACEKYFRAQSQPEGLEPITFRRPTVMDRIFSTMRAKGPRSVIAFGRWLPSLFMSGAWTRRLQKIQAWIQTLLLRSYYNRNAVCPSFNGEVFMYIPLHFQPECTTCPMAGPFMDQQVMVHLLAHCAPPNVLLYIKEHPRQYRMGIACRSVQFYKELKALPNVRLIDHTVSSFLLREHCSAVATGTGTAGFEALFRQKPVLMFGHHFYQFAPGVHRISTREDCKNAMDAIFVKGERPDLFNVRLFLKAVEETTVHASLTDWHLTQASDLPFKAHSQAVYEACIRAIRRDAI
jgi:hypothetical protein